MASNLLSCLVTTILTVKAIVIDTNFGQIEGITNEDGTSTFYNIPYAQPPIGDLRWRPTKPYTTPYDGTFNGTVPGNACVQPQMMSVMMINGSNNQMSEDCLTLSIQTPYDFDNSESESLRPVFFWIHGGGLVAGTGFGYIGGTLPKNTDIVLVSINFRLGVGAWLVDPELYESETGNGGANGFLDMIEALKWVKNNIKAYGGNPDEVTIGGESGGGWATCGLVLSPLASGLFKRSIQMSGSCVESLGKFFSEEEAWSMSKAARDAMNATSFADLHSMDLQVISDTFAGLMKTLLPAIDGYVFPLSTLELVKNGYMNGESTMIGTLFRESFTEKPFFMGKSVQNLDELNAHYYDKLFDAQAKLIQKYYPENEVKSKIWPYGKSDFESNPASLIQTVQSTDCWVKCGAIWQSEMMANHPINRNRAPVYFYQYGYIEQPWDQVSHGYDIIGLFGWDIEWVNGGVAFSDEFVTITQQFFGDYIKGEIDESMSVQNGNYVQIVDKVNKVPMSDLDVVKERCEVYKVLGDGIFREEFCIGIYASDMTPEAMAEMEERFGVVEETDSDADEGVDSSADKQEI